MKNKYKKFTLAINDLIIYLSGFIAIFISILDFSGILSGIPWLSNRIHVITLLAVGLILISIAIERRLSLESISERLKVMEQSGVFGSYYISDTKKVLIQLQKTSEEATDTLMAIGSNSSAKTYLSNIEDQVKNGNLAYYRLLDGCFITHELHDHLEKIIENEHVHIAWTEREKFGNLVVTENDCIIAFPTSREDKFSALRLPGSKNSRLYTQYFLEAYSGCQRLTRKESLSTLCRDCSPESAGNAGKIKEIIAEVEPQVVLNKNSLKPELLS